MDPKEEMAPKLGKKTTHEALWAYSATVGQENAVWSQTGKQGTDNAARWKKEPDCFF